MATDTDADFVESLGPPFLAHRFRRLSEHFVDSVQAFLIAEGVDAPARSASTFALLAAEPGLGITEIAARLKLSHPLVIDLLAQLQRSGAVRFETDSRDRRRRRAFLTEEGQRVAARFERINHDLAAAYGDLSREVGVDLHDLVRRLEAANRRRPFRDRLDAAAKPRPSEKDAA